MYRSLEQIAKVCSGLLSISDSDTQLTTSLMNPEPKYHCDNQDRPRCIENRGYPCSACSVCETKGEGSAAVEPRFGNDLFGLPFAESIQLRFRGSLALIDATRA